MFFKVIQYGYETFQKSIQINTAVVNKRYCKRKRVVISSCFFWKLTFYCKKIFCNLEVFFLDCPKMYFQDFQKYINQILKFGHENFGQVVISLKNK